MTPYTHTHTADRRHAPKALSRILPLVVGMLLAMPTTLFGSPKAHAGNAETTIATAPTASATAPTPSVTAESLPVRLAVILPFKTQLSEGRRSLEFYRGLLLAAEDMKRTGCNIQIAAINEPLPDADLTPVLENAASKADVMLGFFYRNHIIAAGNYCETTGKIAAFPLCNFIPVDLKHNRACVFNATTATQFVEKYARLTVGTLGKGNVVYVKSASPANSGEIADFVRNMKQLGCKTKVVEPGYSIASLEKQLTSKRTNLIVVDTDDTAQLQDLLAAIKAIKAVQPQYAITVLGSSLWMKYCNTPNIFAGIDTYIPVLDNPNMQNAAADALKARYAQQFHTPAANRQPSDLIQGYDFGTMLIDGLAKYGTSFMLFPSTSGHVTNAYSFTNPDDGCWMNDNIRLLHFTPDGLQYLHEFMSK